MPVDWFPLWLSLRVAAISTALAVAIGLGIAWLLANRAFRGKEILDAAVTLPLVLPPTVPGYYLLERSQEFSVHRHCESVEAIYDMLLCEER